MLTALIFTRDEVEEVDDWPGRLGRLGRSSILWIDAEEATEQELETLRTQLGLTDESLRRLARTNGGPYLRNFGDYLHVTAYAPSPREDTRELERIECLVAKSWVVTAHDTALPVLERFRERTEGSGETGRLDGPEFLAVLLEWVLAAYLDAFEQIELALEELDTRAMSGRLRKLDAELHDLVTLRRELGTLRRALVSHREPLFALTRPELETIAGSRSAERFVTLSAHLDEVVEAARDGRDAIVGSFDILIARTEQRTNEIVKVLTIASVLLLPAALIAGVMGMNFRLGMFDENTYFWVVLGSMAALAAVTLGVMRARRWI